MRRTLLIFFKNPQYFKHLKSIEQEMIKFKVQQKKVQKVLKMTSESEAAMINYIDNKRLYFLYSSFETQKEKYRIPENKCERID